MDWLDVRILRAMGIRPYERRPKDPQALRASRIAAAVGSTVVTVKERIARMEEAGVIAGYQLYPNFRHLGLAACAYFFRVTDGAPKAAALADVRGLRGLLELHDFLGAGVCADFAYHDEAELEEKVQVISRSTGDPDPQRFYDRAMPPVRRPLGRLDWRILHALRGRARRPLAEVAEAVGSSLRTVKRRYDAMARDGSFFIVPQIDASKAAGLILFELLLFVRPDSHDQAVPAILKAFDDRFVYAYRPVSPHLGNFDLLLFATNSGEVEALRRRGESVPGVARAEAWLFGGFFDFSSWMDEAIAAQIGERESTPPIEA